MDIASSKGRVLLIEDDPSHALLIERALKAIGRTVTHVDRLSRVQAVFEAAPDWEVILSDLNLPDSKPEVTVATVVDLSKGTPVVVLTSSERIEDAVHALQGGARDFLVKNFSDQFRTVLALTLSRAYEWKAAEALRLKLVEEREMLAGAIQAGPEALAIIDSAGQLRYGNTLFQAIAGGAVPLAEWFNGRVTGWQDQSKAVLDQLMGLSAGSFRHAVVRFGEGDSLTVYEVIAIVLRSLPEPLYAFWFHDTSDLARQQRFERDLFATTTHDVKGPLASIVLTADLLKDDRPREQRLEFCVRIEGAARRALQVLEEFLSARQIHEGGLTLRPMQTFIGEAVQDVVSDFCPLAQSKGITIRTTVSPQLRFQCDPLALRRILGNLLSNAIKFGRAQSEVDIGADGLGGALRLWVKDQGEGIASAEIARLFSRYGRLEKHRAISGTGLGLFVVDTLVRAHGGHLEVESTIGQGTTFIIVIPDPAQESSGEDSALSGEFG